MAYLTTAEIAERYGVSRREIGRLRESGKLPYEKKIPGRTGVYLYDAETVEEYFARIAREKTAPEPAESGDGGSPGEDSGAG